MLHEKFVAAWLQRRPNVPCRTDWFHGDFSIFFPPEKMCFFGDFLTVSTISGTGNLGVLGSKGMKLVKSVENW
jgi:hypothetical protein